MEVVNTGVLLVSLFEVDCAGAQEDDGCAKAWGGTRTAWVGIRSGSEDWRFLVNCSAKAVNLLLEVEDEFLLKDILNEVV